MALKSTKKINVDFYNQKYILINAKQNDKNSRFLEITCYNHGELFSLNPNNHSAFIRYRKADEHGVFNSCVVNYNGTIEVELTEQMLAVAGICYADLVIVDSGYATVDPNTGEITGINNSAILSTMTFCIDVVETALENSVIESTHEFDKFNTMLETHLAEYEQVILAAKSWAIGDTDIEGREDIEDTDNAKYYAQQASASASSASASKNAAASSQTAAANSAKAASASASDASVSETNASNSAEAAAKSASAASKSEQAAGSSEDAASSSAKAAEEAKAAAEISKSAASTSESNALTYANRAQSWAVGGTGTRTGENTNNSQYWSDQAWDYAANAALEASNASNSADTAKEYCDEIKIIINSLNSSFIPMGTVSFAELKTVEKVVGYVYNISDDFVTDNTFRDGAGKSYTAGTNVYCTASDEWDCLGGAALLMATVDEVKTELGI